MFWFIGDQHSSRHSPSAVFQISLDSGDVAEQQKEGISEQLQSWCISLQCTTSNILQTGAANFRTETHSLFTPGLGREAKNSPRWVFWGINALITEFLRFYSFSWIFFCISGIQRNQFLLCTTGPKDSSGVTKNSVWPCPLYVDRELRYSLFIVGTKPTKWGWSFSNFWDPPRIMCQTCRTSKLPTSQNFLIQIFCCTTSPEGGLLLTKRTMFVQIPGAVNVIS